MSSTYQDGCCSRILLFGFLGLVRDVSVAFVFRRGGALWKISELLRDAPLDILGGGGRVFVACKLFFTSERKQSFFFARNV